MSPAQAALQALSAGRPASHQPEQRSVAVGGDPTEVIFVDRGGWEPLGLVSGCAVFHVGVVGWPRGNTEVVQLSTAMYDARERALGGLRDAGSGLGADGVVNAAVDIHFMEDHRHLPRFVATGTAIRRKGLTRPGRTEQQAAPFVTTMTASEIGLLSRAGYRAIGVVLGSCVYHVGRRSASEWARSRRRNLELDGYSAAFYDARELAMTRLQDEARGVGAEGVVGVMTAERSHVWGSRVIEFFAMGNAVISVEGQSGIDAPVTVIPLNDLVSRIEPASIVEEPPGRPARASAGSGAGQ
jgi:uncharacterized protein YbjQ (UPF0145 family)